LIRLLRIIKQIYNSILMKFIFDLTFFFLKIKRIFYKNDIFNDLL